jgi:hypothetical protein
MVMYLTGYFMIEDLLALFKWAADYLHCAQCSRALSHDGALR